MLEEAEKRNEFRELKEVVEASSGSTAISLVQISHIKHIKPTIFLPNDLAEDKVLPHITAVHILVNPRRKHSKSASRLNR